MLINPDIEAWFEKLQGRRLGAGGSAPRGQGLPNYGSSAVQGIVQPGRGMFGFTAPPIRSNYRPTPIAPNPAERSPSGIPAPFEGISGGGRDLGGGAKAAGLQKLGSGIEQAMKGLAEKRLAAQQAADLVKPYLGGPLSDQMRRNPGATMPPGAATAPPAAPAPYSPAPIGAVSETPTITKMGEGPQPIPPIGAGGSLPTFAQGAPGGAAPDQMAAYRNAIASIESRGSGDYAAIGPVTRNGDRAYGRYQVMGENVPAWTKAALGYSMTPEQFMADKSAQDAVFNQQFGQAVKQYGQNGAANWWFTGKSNPPATANDRYTTAPEYLRRFNAALGPTAAPPPLTAPSAQAFAANPPSLTEPTVPQFAGPGAAPAPGSQPVIPGQGDPHAPGFDPNSVPFHRTPEMGPAPIAAPPPGPTAPAIVAPPTQDTGSAEPHQITAGQPQTGPAYSDQTWNNRPQFDYSAPATGAANVPVPPPRPADSSQPPILNGGQPGVYDMPGQSGMINMPTPQDQLASALANGAPDQTPQLDQSAMLSMALAQPDFVAPPPIDFGGGGFGGFDFGRGMFG